MTATLDTITWGDDYTVTATITKDESTYDITGATVTCSISVLAHPETKLIADHAVTITTAASGIVTLTLTAAETASLRRPPTFEKAIMHIADFKVTESGGNKQHSERFFVPVLRGVT